VGKNDHYKKEIMKQSTVLKCWIFSFEGCRLLMKFGRSSWRPRDKYIALFGLKIVNFLSTENFTFLDIKSMDPDPELDPDHYQLP
jgi:hypothetical protein